MKRSIKVYGIEQSVVRIKSHTGKTMKVVNDRMGELAEQIKEKSLIYCPIATGALRGTAKVERTEKGGGLGVTWTISYGDETVDYAAAVHNIVSAYHAPPTGAFYLARATQEVKADFNTRGLSLTSAEVT